MEPETPFVSLGEGGTPLLPVEVSGRQVYLKCEHLNPTGSFKDRGTAVLVSALQAAGVRSAIEDSSGNAGASLAAYAARAGMAVEIYVPEHASGAKCDQIASYGAKLVRVEGPRASAAQAALDRAERGAVYASHSYHPHGMAGMATVAFELVEQLGQVPGAVIAPAGQGTLLLGMALGFQSLISADAIDRLPKLVGVQARACAPLWFAHNQGGMEWGGITEKPTLAEGIRTADPLRGEAFLKEVARSGGTMSVVDEDDILLGYRALARRGLFVEPTSAVVWAALLDEMDNLPDPVVVVLTGSGLKDVRPIAGETFSQGDQGLSF